jgi:competence protein ComEC
VFVACDIGQGDALVLDAGPHVGVVVDTGPEPVATNRCLDDLGITDIPLLFITHFHLDHVGGITGAMRDRRVGRIVTGPLPEPASGVAIVTTAARSRGVGMSVGHPGDRFDAGGLHLDVLGPAAPFHNTHSDPNNSSLVMRATVRGVRILLSGDAEIEAQQAMVSAGVDLRADVLKVWHHGSAYFYPGYLAAVHARTAVISVGAHNDYGHPSPLALAALARAGIPVSRTDQDGDVAVTVNSGKVETVDRGVAASTVGMGASVSVLDARMRVCPPARSPPTTSLRRCRT